MIRPGFKSAWAAFMAVRVSVSDVGKKIGGHVRMNIDSGIFQNACPIRMSYVLNATGFPIARNARYETVSGGDGMFYIYRVNDMMNYLQATFGNPDKTVHHPKAIDFSGMKGILVVKGSGWVDARGHVTLWNGEECSDQCHLVNDPDNGAFMPETASLWVLP